MRSVRALDNVSFTQWFKSHGGSQASIDRMWDPIGGFLRLARLNDCGCVWMCVVWQGRGNLAGPAGALAQAKQ
jgi:zeta-carotene desaturase